jgi:2,4-dienoyl-CoA reductase (NADPH2)
MITGVRYDRIDDDGLHVAFPREGGRTRVLRVDNVVVCAGQEPLRELAGDVRAAGVPVHLVGGADVAVELDAKRAIEQATTIALAI